MNEHNADTRDEFETGSKQELDPKAILESAQIEPAETTEAQAPVSFEETLPHRPVPSQRGHIGILLSLLAIVVVLVILLILGINFLKKNLQAPAYREVPNFSQSENI
jgi:hypothetical protein